MSDNIKVPDEPKRDMSSAELEELFRKLEPERREFHEAFRELQLQQWDAYWAAAAAGEGEPLSDGVAVDGTQSYEDYLESQGAKATNEE